MANISPEVVLWMLFLILSSVNIDILDRKLWWRTYIIQEAFLITRRVELVRKKWFAAVALDLEYETFVVYVASLSSFMSFSSTPLDTDIHPSCRPQIASLIAEKAFLKIPAEYANFTDVFFRTWCLAQPYQCIPLDENLQRR